jgi:hypothetical protein
LSAIGARNRREIMPPAKVTMEFKVIARETT